MAMTFPSFPRAISLSLTGSCNLNCMHCRIGSRRETNPRLLDSFGFARVIKDLASVRRDFTVILSGGEPLLFHGLGGLVRAISYAGVRPVLTTNGLLLDEARVLELASAGLREVVVSIDGFRVIHDTLRRKKGAFKGAMSAIDRVRSLAPGMTITVLAVISAFNLDQIVAFAQWLGQDPRIDRITFQFVAQPMPDQLDDYWFRKSDLWPSDPEEAGRVLDELISLREAPGSKITNPVMQLAAAKRYFSNPLQSVQGTCRKGFKYLSLDATGHVCTCVSHPPMARMEGPSILEILSSRQAAEHLQRMRECRSNCHHLINCFYDETEEETPIVIP